MKEVSQAARFGIVLLVTAIAACTSGAPATFTLNSASVDALHACPVSAQDAAYALHATIEVRNGSSRIVTIKSVTAQMTLTATKGSWLQKVGDTYEAFAWSFSPDAVAAGSSSSLKIEIPSACTSGRTPSVESSSGEYSVELTVVTSSGAYRIVSKNRHRILAA